MFSNLVHLSLIRTIKSRWSFWGLMFVIGCLLIYVITFAQIRAGEFPASSDEADASVKIVYGTVLQTMNMNVYWQQTMFSFVIVYLPLFMVINTAFVTCDYYKYRLYINIEGAVSKKKIILADCCALAVVSFGFTLISALLVTSGLLFGDSEYMLITMTGDYIGSLISLFLDVFILNLVAYMFSQLTRSKALGASLTFVFVIFYSAIINFLCGYLLGRAEALSITFDYDLFVCFTSPMNYFGMAFEKVGEPIRVGLLIFDCFSLAFQAGILVILSMIFAARRRES